jgi:hypothetical protein
MTDVGSDGAIEVTCRLIYLTVIITTYTGTENIWSTVLGSYGEKSIWQKWSLCDSGWEMELHYVGVE